MLHPCSIRFLQSDIRQLAVIREENRRLLEAILDDGDTPEEAAEKRELAEILRCIIEELPSEQREAILLYYYEDLSLAEVAQEQNCPVPTVKSRLRYAKQSIRAAILAEAVLPSTVHCLFPFCR